MTAAGTGWCELHAHSAFSLLDGASRPEALAARAAELGYPALALTDHDSLAGLVAHARACAAAGIRPIAGVELTLDDGSHLILLACDALGYRALCRLVSSAQLAGTKGAPRATLDDVAAHAAGLECLTGCSQGRVAAALLRGDEQGARAALEQLCDIFGAAHTWVEVQRPGRHDDRRLSFGLARLAHRTGLGLVATGNAHYARPDDRDLQDVLVCIRHRVPVAAARPYLRPGASWHLRSPAETARRFADLPAALRGAATLAGRCGFALDHVDAALPTFPVPAGHTPETYLRALTLAGARERYGTTQDIPQAVQARLDHELEVITQLGMAGYFLIVWDLVRYAREQGILCQGRGSAVGSAVCYCLGITAVEPLAHHLSFERFLSAGRADPPDIDLDLPADRDGAPPAREAVIQYALSRWAGHAALVANVITFRARLAVREVGLALGLAPEHIDALAREKDPWHVTGTPHAAGAYAIRPYGRMANPADYGREEAAACGRSTGEDQGGPQAPQCSYAAIGDPTFVGAYCIRPGRLSQAHHHVLRRLHDLCARIEGLPRHLGQHPGGVVITARPLAEVAPLERARMPGRIIVQWDKEAVEGAGLVKIDLLGLGMLGAIDRCFDLIARQTRDPERAGERPALHGFRCDDPAVYALLCAADTVGVFQVESRAQISACLPHLQPRCYEDLIVAVALIRPGPIQGNATQPYLRRRRGEEPIRYPGGETGRRLLAPILGETLGVCLYQDQVIAIGTACGLSPGEAAELRRAMSSARGAERMAALRARLEAGLAARGLDEAARAEVLSMVQAFAGYGFVKGHAAAFAYLAYVSCWLKVHHPAAFYAALLNMQPMGFYPPDVLLQDAARHGVRVLPVDVRYSRADCTLEGGALRLGLRLVRGLGSDACARLGEALAASPPPRDLEELCTRARLHEDEARALARSGALRGYVPERRQALWQAPPVARAARERWLPALLAAVDPPVRLPAPTPLEDLALDRAALGLAPGRHVLTYLRPELRHRPLRRADELAALPTATVVEVVGQVIARQQPPTAKGVLFLGLSDETGLLNVVVPPSVYQRDRAVVRGEALLWVAGVLERRSGGPTVRATQLRPLAAILV